jgi:hypothetical protein
MPPTFHYWKRRGQLLKPDVAATLPRRHLNYQKGGAKLRGNVD